MPALSRFLSALLWPISVWPSLTHLAEHPDDDYVERTSPIVATAIGFWVCAALLAALLAGQNLTYTIFTELEVVHIVRRQSGAAIAALWAVTPVLYLVGLWLFTAREERYRGSSASQPR